jgi:Na+/proline symporter
MSSPLQMLLIALLIVPLLWPLFQSEEQLSAADVVTHVLGPFAAIGSFVAVVLMIAVACGA